MKFILIISILTVQYSAFGAAEKDCGKHQHWVRPHTQSAYFRTDGTPVSSSFKNGFCRNNQKSYKQWGNTFTNELPKNWPHKEIAKKWTTSEEEAVLDAIDKIPKFLSDLENIKLYRAIRSVTKGNYATSAKNIITLYNTAFESEEILRRVLIHELAHNYYQGMTSIDQTEANTALGWRLGRSNSWSPTKKSVLIAPDSHDSPEEAYANLIEYYLVDKTRLKFKAPDQFKWAELTYGGNIK